MPATPAKVLKIIGFLKKFRLKYLIASLVTLFMVQSMFGFAQDKRIGSEVLSGAVTPQSDSIIPSSPLKDSVPTARQARNARRNRVVGNDSTAAPKKETPAFGRAGDRKSVV